MEEEAKGYLKHNSVWLLGITILIILGLTTYAFQAGRKINLSADFTDIWIFGFCLPLGSLAIALIYEGLKKPKIQTSKIETSIPLIAKRGEKHQKETINLEGYEWIGCTFNECDLIVERGNFRVFPLNSQTFNRCRLIPQGGAVNLTEIGNYFVNSQFFLIEKSLLSGKQLEQVQQLMQGHTSNTQVSPPIPDLEKIDFTKLPNSAVLNIGTQDSETEDVEVPEGVRGQIDIGSTGSKRKNIRVKERLSVKPSEKAESSTKESEEKTDAGDKQRDSSEGSQT